MKEIFSGWSEIVFNSGLQKKNDENRKVREELIKIT
jgi:hypothetical protein